MARGWTLLRRRYRATGGEIDLIGLDGETLVFVEVKSRTMSVPEEAVDERKIRRMLAAAEHFLHKYEQSERVCRFDVIAIDRNGIRHYADAFRPW